MSYFWIQLPTLVTCCLFYLYIYMAHIQYPDYPNIEFWIVPAYSVPNLVFTLLMIVYGNRFSFRLRIVGTFTITGIVMALIPVLVIDVAETPSYDLLMIICSFVGIASAILQATTIGFTNLLPPKYTQSNISGQSVAGILACIIRIFTKALEPNDNSGYINGGWYYFTAGAVGNIICGLAFIWAANTDFVQYYLFKNDEKTANNKKESIELGNFDTSKNDESDVVSSASVSQKPDLKQVWNKIKRPAIACFCKFYIVFLYMY